MNVFAFLGGLGGGEILMILVVILLLFGATRIPEVARSLGRSMSEFKKGVKDGAQEDDKTIVSTEEEQKLL